VTVGRLRDCVLNLENKLLLETTVSNQLSGSAQRIEKSDDCDETEGELRVQIEDLQMELEDNRSEIDHLVSVSLLLCGVEWILTLHVFLDHRGPSWKNRHVAYRDEINRFR
jgi:hypothetical protein